METPEEMSTGAYGMRCLSGKGDVVSDDREEMEV